MRALFIGCVGDSPSFMSETRSYDIVERLLRIDVAHYFTTFLRHYSASIGTAVPLTTIPPVAGISTVSRLGRPIASP